MHEKNQADGVLWAFWGFDGLTLDNLVRTCILRTICLEDDLKTSIIQSIVPVGSSYERRQPGNKRKNKGNKPWETRYGFRSIPHTGLLLGGWNVG